MKRHIGVVLLLTPLVTPQTASACKSRHFLLRGALAIDSQFDMGVAIVTRSLVLLTKKGGKTWGTSLKVSC